MNVLDETIDYIKTYGGQEVEQVTLIPESHLGNYRKVPHAFRIQIEVLGGPATLVVGLPKDFPSSLPLFFDSQRQFGFIPHIEEDGFICYTRDENIVIDERYPGAVVLDCLKKVIDVLKNGETKSNNFDFLEEFEVYWSKTCAYFAHAMIDEQDESVRELDLIVLSFEEDLSFFAYERTMDPFLYMEKLFHQDLSAKEKRRCLYIPLDPGTFIKPPRKGEVWSLKELKDNIFNHLSKIKKDRLLQLLRRSPKSSRRIEHLILSVTIESNKKALFGVILHYPDGKVHNRKAKVMLHPLIQSPAKINLVPVHIKRHYKEFLFTRTGSGMEFVSKHAVVIGVGAIGSVVALGLSKAGFKTITLIDHDWLDTENVYRHELGVDLVYTEDAPIKLLSQKKVHAMKKEIERKYPFTHVNAIDKKISDVFENNQIDWSNVDVVVVCIGSPNVEMLISRFMHKLSGSPPVIHAWVEPFGIGGHILVTLNKVEEGCYQCLFRPISDETPISNLSAFAATGQTFTKSLGGCGTYFTPYSFLDSEETALLALRTIFNVLRNQIQGNPILSWKGDAAQFLQAGYRLSERFGMSAEELYAKRQSYINPTCPVCSIEGSKN
ncbi:molybdopterin/thiamine biosynthesis adenylyltransferase [Paenibacillus mucilaginosus]